MTRPRWADEYLTDDQAANVDRPYTVWVILLNRSAVSPHAHHVALRLHLYTLGRDAPSIYPAVASLAADVKLSPTTVRAALAELESCGWIRRQSRWLATGEPTSSLIELSWPTSASMANMQQGVADGLCGARRSPKKSGTCRRRAGFGTATPGVGPCVHHGGPPPSRGEVPPSSDEVPPSRDAVHTPREARPSTSSECITEFITEATAHADACADVIPLPARRAQEEQHVGA